MLGHNDIGSDVHMVALTGKLERFDEPVARAVIVE
jgi:hypothetical protein